MKPLLKAVLCACGFFGCSQTGFELIWAERTDATGGTDGGGDGGNPPAMAGGTAGTTGGGGGAGGLDPGPPPGGGSGDQDNGETGAGGMPSGPDCSSGMDDVELGYVRLRHVGSGLCLAQGEAIEVGGEPAFEVVLAECSGAAGQLWLLQAALAQSYGVWNVGAQMTLDMQYAGTADGTPAVLFRKVGLDNQRFYFRARPEGGFWISPGNVLPGGSLKCLKESATGVDLRPCVASDPSEVFVVLDGTCF